MTERRDASEAALAIVDEAIQLHRPSHVFGLFSGGHDSATSTAIAAKHPAFSGAFHVNTRTGIRRTLQYVRETAPRLV